MTPRGAAKALRSNGFTLAEILVVLLVIGIAAGFVYAELTSDPRRALEREGLRLAAALEHAAALAQWKSESLGFSANGGVYRFWRRGGDNNWTAVSDDDVLQPRALPDSLVAAPLWYAGQSVPADAIVPLRASGRNEPYVVELDSPEWRVLLSADPFNRVQMSGPSAR